VDWNQELRAKVLESKSKAKNQYNDITKN